MNRDTCHMTISELGDVTHAAVTKMSF